MVVLAILVAINYLSSRHNKRWDLTAAKQFTLSEQTRKVLQSLERPVRIKVFAGSEDFARFRERLDEFTYASPQVQVEYIDAVKRPSLANQYKVEALGTVIIEYDGRVERVTSDGEQELVNGVVKAVQGKQHKVYFVQGHGERDPAASDRPGYSAIKGALGSDNYTVDKLVLAQQKEVPADASVLVAAGPRTDFLPNEIEMPTVTVFAWCLIASTGRVSSSMPIVSASVRSSITSLGVPTLPCSTWYTSSGVIPVA